MFKTTAIYENRIRDMKELFAEIPLKEEGDANTLFLTSKNNLLCTGYERIVFGDHGPYIEFSVYQINIDNLFGERLGTGYYDKFYSRDDTRVLMYGQRQTVANLPNPPKGPRSFYGKRKEGYADYKVGFYYICPWEKNLKIVQNGVLINNNKSCLSEILGG